MSYRVGIDIGGTFTDFALLEGSELTLHKNLSTPADRSVGVMDGLKRLADIQGSPLREFLGRCDAIVHATTVADNTLIEMNGALTGLISGSIVGLVVMVPSTRQNAGKSANPGGCA